MIVDHAAPLTSVVRTTRRAQNAKLARTHSSAEVRALPTAAHAAQQTSVAPISPRRVCVLVVCLQLVAGATPTVARVVARSRATTLPRAQHVPVICLLLALCVQLLVVNLCVLYEIVIVNLCSLIIIIAVGACCGASETNGCVEDVLFENCSPSSEWTKDATCDDVCGKVFFFK